MHISWFDQVLGLGPNQIKSDLIWLVLVWVWFKLDFINLIGLDLMNSWPKPN